MNKKLIIMVGIPGSGKTVKSLEILNCLGKDTTIRVSTDEIRGELYGDPSIQGKTKDVVALAHSRIRDGLNSHKNVIVDSTNLTIKNRKTILDYNWDGYEKIAYIMTTSIEEAKRRNSQRDRVVPDEVIDRMISRFQVPFYEEGFDDIILDGFTIEDEYDFDVSRYAELTQLMDGFNQKNPHHCYDLGTHCAKVTTSILEQNENCSGFSSIALAARIHDIGKLYTQTYDSSKDICHYYNHENYGAYFMLDNLDAISFGNKRDVLDVLFYINYHMLPFTWNKDETKEKYRNIFGEEKYKQLLMLHESDIENTH